MDSSTIIVTIIVVFLDLGIGVFIGLMIGRNNFKNDKCSVGGVIHVDDSDPDGPYFFLELNEEIDKMVKDGYLNVKVQMEHYISQE